MPGYLSDEEAMNYGAPDQDQGAPMSDEQAAGFGNEEAAMREKAQANQGYLPQAGAFITGVGETIPFAKDIASGLKTGASYLWGNELQGTPGERFEQAKRKQEQAQRILGEEYPMTQMAGTAAGIGAQIMAPGTRALAAGERAAAEMAGEAVPKMLAPAARGAVHVGAGAGVGAAYGAGEGVTPQERMENALIGAGVGAAGSAAAPIVGTIARPIGQKLGFVKQTPGVMSKDELFDAAKDAYRSSEQQGIMI